VLVVFSFFSGILPFTEQKRTFICQRSFSLSSAVFSPPPRLVSLRNELIHRVFSSLSSPLCTSRTSELFHPVIQTFLPPVGHSPPSRCRRRHLTQAGPLPQTAHRRFPPLQAILFLNFPSSFFLPQRFAKCVVPFLLDAPPPPPLLSSERTR